MNKQPFYYRVDGLLFTSTRVITEDEFTAFIRLAAAKLPIMKIISESVEIEPTGFSYEAGDPTDLI